MSARPSSSTTTAPTASAPEDSSPGASGADAQSQGAAGPDADTPSDSPANGQATARADGPTDAPADAPGGRLDAAVLIQDDGWVESDDWPDNPPGAEELARRATLAAWDALPDKTRPAAPHGAEVSVVLADDATVQALNRDYRGQDKPTNVLSFANLDDAQAPDTPDGEPVLLGDVVLARETVLAEARAQGKTPGDHLSHLCVHGLLHLLGYDHMADAEAAAMEALERHVLARLGIADPYALTNAGGAPAVDAAAGGAS